MEILDIASCGVKGEIVGSAGRVFSSTLFSSILRIVYILWSVSAEETYKWRNITVAAYLACIGLGIYTLSGEEPHGSEQPVCCIFCHIGEKEGEKVGSLTIVDSVTDVLFGITEHSHLGSQLHLVLYFANQELSLSFCWRCTS